MKKYLAIAAVGAAFIGGLTVHALAAPYVVPAGSIVRVATDAALIAQCDFSKTIIQGITTPSFYYCAQK